MNKNFYIFNIFLSSSFACTVQISNPYKTHLYIQYYVCVHTNIPRKSENNFLIESMKILKVDIIISQP